MRNANEKSRNKLQAGMGERGQSAVEFAIILPLLLVLLLNFIEWGFVLWAQGTYENAVRDGARAGAVFTDWNSNFTNRSGEVKSIVVARLQTLPSALRTGVESRITTAVNTDVNGIRSVKVMISNQPYGRVTGFPGVVAPAALSAAAEFRCESGQ